MSEVQTAMLALALTVVRGDAIRAVNNGLDGVPGSVVKIPSGEYDNLVATGAIRPLNSDEERIMAPTPSADEQQAQALRSADAERMDAARDNGELAVLFDFPGRTPLMKAGVLTVQDVAGLLPSEIDAIDGIGPSTAKSIDAALNSDEYAGMFSAAEAVKVQDATEARMEKEAADEAAAQAAKEAEAAKKEADTAGK